MSLGAARERRPRTLAVAGVMPVAALIMIAGCVLAAAVAALGSAALRSGEARGGGEAGVSARAIGEIPAAYLALYRAAAARYGIDWAILAAIGRVECNHGRDPDPSCTVPGAENSAGAGGPMQFLASTWAGYGVDGNGDGLISRWQAPDAIFSAANYLRASGAPGDYTRAIFAYNHASWYVAEVQRIAAGYRGATAAGSSGAPGATESPANGADAGATPIRYVDAARASLDPADPHVALIPLAAPPVVRAMLIAGDELQDLPYGPSGHPDPRGAPDEDCSSSLNYVLYRAGMRPIGEILTQNPLAQDYVHWGSPGPGRWVTIYATASPTPHVFVVIAGLRLDTSHNGTDVGPNRGEDGPRWRLLDHIPTWAHWSVRHPPGL